MTAADIKIKKTNIETHNETFAEIMSNGKQYVIPRFQRDYSWGAEQWEDLWEDADKIKTGGKQHFMGYVVLRAGEDDWKSFNLIDGQQRLTTLTLVVLAAVNRLNALAGEKPDAENDVKRGDVLYERFIGEIDVQTLSSRPKLELNRHNARHFRSMLAAKGVNKTRNLNPGNRRLNQAFEFFLGKMAEISDAREIASLINRIFGDGLLFTVVTVRENTDAYAVFETLNARGVHLSTSDLLKNRLLSTMAGGDEYNDEHFKDFEEKWGEIAGELGETEYAKFLRSYEGMRGETVKAKDLYQSLQRRVDDPGKVFPYLRELETHAPAYAALQNHNDDLWKNHYEKARAHIEFFQMFGIKEPLSLLMAGYASLEVKAFIKLLGGVAAVTVRYNIICGKSANYQEDIYSRLADKINRGEIGADEAIRGLARVYPGDSEFKSAFADKEMRSSNKKARFLLRAIETHLSGGSEPAENMSVEHVLPKAPDNAWQEYFGRADYVRAIDRIGNLALLPEAQNREMGQKPFEEKKQVLLASGYHINRHIAGYESWNMDSLNRHQKWLAEQAAALWRIPQLAD